MTRNPSISKTDLYTMLLPAQCAVQRAPKVFLRFWQDYHVVPQQRSYNFEGNWDHSVLAASVVLPWIFRHQRRCGCDVRFRDDMVEHKHLTSDHSDRCIFKYFCKIVPFWKVCILRYWLVNFTCTVLMKSLAHVCASRTVKQEEVRGL